MALTFSSSFNVWWLGLGGRMIFLFRCACVISLLHLFVISKLGYEKLGMMNANPFDDLIPMSSMFLFLSTKRGVSILSCLYVVLTTAHTTNGITVLRECKDTVSLSARAAHEPDPDHDHEHEGFKVQESNQLEVAASKPTTRRRHLSAIVRTASQHRSQRRRCPARPLSVIMRTATQRLASRRPTWRVTSADSVPLRNFRLPQDSEAIEQV